MLKLSIPFLLPALAAISVITPAAATPCNKADVRCAQLVQWAQDYPFVKDRQPSSYLFVSGGVYPFATFQQDLSSASVRVPGERKAMPVNRLLQLLKEPESSSLRTPVIAYGSNAAPWVLADKFTRLYGGNQEYKGSMVIPVTKATLRDYDVTWLAHVTGGGGLPATISTAPATEVEVWLTWLDAEQLAWMNSSEEIGEAGGMYSLNRMPRAQLSTTGYALDQDPLVYVSCHGALRAPNGKAVAIAQIPALRRTMPAKTSIDTLAYTASLLKFPGTGFELLADTIATLHQDGILKERNAVLQAHAVASPRLALAAPQYACKP
jgi:hypothetical protein